jgi:hypothetical protein
LSFPHREIITVIAKTYPECSKKYGCLVCVAGINEEGLWRRIYPIPYELFFKSMKEYERLRFRKFDKISVLIRKADTDPRIESYRILDPRSIQVVGSVSDWEERRELAMRLLAPGLNTLTESARSLGIIKPKRIKDFILQPRHRLRREERNLLDKQIQTLLPEFANSKMGLKEIKPMELPWIGYDYYCFDPDCRGHKMMCLDWEIQELYRKYYLRTNDEEEAFEKTKERALDFMLKRDLYFCVGTTWRFPTWIIISLIYPPAIKQQKLPLPSET